MPPKSSAKKEQILWYLCEKCKVNITSTDREQHESKYCPIIPDSSRPLTTSFIYQKTLYSTTISTKLPQLSDLNDLPENLLNNFIYVSEGAMNLCGFILGDSVILTSPQCTEVVVRTIWPISDRFLTTVYLNENGTLKGFVWYFVVI